MDCSIDNESYVSMWKEYESGNKKFTGTLLNGRQISFPSHYVCDPDITVVSRKHQGDYLSQDASNKKRKYQMTS